MKDHEKSISMIEQDMARARAEIERTTDELKARVEPERLADAARQVIVESTSRVEERVKALADSAGGHAETFGDTAIEYIQANPIPALLAGVGLGLLVTLAERDVFSSHPPTLERSAPGRINQALANNPSLLKAQRRTVRQARRINRQNPLLLGAAIFGAGLLLGALLPATEREDELLGPTRDRLIDAGKEQAQQALELAKGVVEEEVDKRKAEAAELKETVEDTALRAFHEARNETIGSRDEALVEEKLLERESNLPVIPQQIVP